MLSGKKEPNVDLLKNLHYQFHIDGNILLDSLRNPKKEVVKKSAKEAVNPVAKGSSSSKKAAPAKSSSRAAVTRKRTR